MTFKGRDIINIKDFSREDLEHIINVAFEMEKMPRGDAKNILQNYITACLFFEPSTRTNNSFQTAALRLGANVLDPDLMEGSSITKGESFNDTIRMFDSYTDAIVIRHPQINTAKIAADIAKNPVINAGDGPNQHPTQTMLDLYTMKKEKDRIDGLKIAMIGDLKYGRTVHSLATALTRFSPDYVAFVSPDELKMPEVYIRSLKNVCAEVEEFERIEDLPRDIDFIYMTRIQKERFENLEDYERLAGVYQFSLKTLNHFNDSVRIMHPLPRIEGPKCELLPEVDNAPQALYFQQAANGVPIRMALLALVLGAVE